MNLDVIVTFNDVDNFRDASIGFNKKTYRGKPLTLPEQIIVLCESFKKNYTGQFTFYALHSLDLQESVKQRMERHGIIVKHIECSFLDGRINNRVTAYGDVGDGDYSLVLDADMILLKDIKIPTDANIYMMPEAFQLYSNDAWLMFHRDLKIDTRDKRDMLHNPFHFYHMTSNSRANIVSRAFNNGATLIRNDVKSQVVEVQEQARDYLIGTDVYKSNPHSAHFIEQTMMGIVWEKLQGEYLPKGFNYYIPNGGKITYNDVSLFHYIGGRSLELFESYFECLK